MTDGSARTALLLAMTLVALPAAARQEPPWSSLRFSAAGAESVTRVGMHTWWRPRTGGLLRVEIPFQGGFLESGVRGMPLEARSGDVPPYTALLVWAGWGGAWSPLRPVRLSAALRSGLLRMDFEEDIAFAGVRSESELAVGGAARIEVVPLPRLGFFAEIAAERVLTAYEIDQVHVAAGLVVRVGTPSWLRRVLE